MKLIVSFLKLEIKVLMKSCTLAINFLGWGRKKVLVSGYEILDRIRMKETVSAAVVAKVCWPQRVAIG